VITEILRRAEAASRAGNGAEQLFASLSVSLRVQSESDGSPDCHTFWRNADSGCESGKNDPKSAAEFQRFSAPARADAGSHIDVC
jgi:hypothetical protein